MNSSDFDPAPVQSRNVLFGLARSLHRHPDADRLLEEITREILNLVDAQGTTVLLLDHDTGEFFFSAAAFRSQEIENKIQNMRFPKDKGVAGRVLETGKPVMVNDTRKNPWFFREVDRQTGFITKTMLDVPIRIHNRIIGVLSTVNKKSGKFNEQDTRLLSAIADIIAHPIENTRINEELTRSYQEVNSLNKAKDRVIHHLSHELKTPVSVLAASLDLLEKRLTPDPEGELTRIFHRAQRNLQRLLEMQYEIEDLLQKKDHTTFNLLSKLLTACVDELEALISQEMGGMEVIRRIEGKIEEIFGPWESIPEIINPGSFLEKMLPQIGLRFAHRECRIIKKISPTPPILIPEDVLMKIIEGVIKNAVENTPDKGEILVTMSLKDGRPLLEVEDFGVGITHQNLNLLFENYFTAYDTESYRSGRPYEFGAGGKGFDLLRLKIFSEQYKFKIGISSRRCTHIHEETYSCPGNIDRCQKITSHRECRDSGGTRLSILFSPAETQDHERI